jgi:hypothetical protein
MKSKIFAVVTASLLLLAFAIGVQAALITSCTLDRDLYKQGETGYVLLTVYNDKDNTIRVTEVTAVLDYFYADGTAFSQTFFTNATLPIEILPRQSSTFYISFSLPVNMASGYIRPLCRAKTELWNTMAQRWYQSDFPTAEPVLYVESPYKEQFEEQQEVNQQLENQLTQQENTIGQLEEKLQTLQTSYDTTTLAVYILIAITLALGATMAFLMMSLRKPRATPSPPPQ